MGRLAEAIAEYQASLSIDPGVPEVHYELAYALAQIPGACRRPSLSAKKCCSSSPVTNRGDNCWRRC